MASNITLGYHQLRESKRHNQIVESETYRHNLVTEDQGQQDLDQRLNIANADRASRENIAALDRSSRESIADKDRSSRESIANRDRASRETIAELDRDVKQDIANRDRESRQLIASQDRMTNLAKSKLEVDSRAKLQEDQQKFLDEQRRYSNIYNATGYDPNNTIAQNLLTAGTFATNKMNQQIEKYTNRALDLFKILL